MAITVGNQPAKARRHIRVTSKSPHKRPFAKHLFGDWPIFFARMADTEPKAVYVEWIDITTSGDVWFKVDDEDYELSVIKSIGYLLKENDTQIVITTSYSEGEAIHYIVIPRVVIKRLEYLTLPEGG